MTYRIRHSEKPPFFIIIKALHTEPPVWLCAVLLKGAVSMKKIKRAVALLSSALLLAGLPLYCPEAAAPVTGDLNSDGNVNAADLSALVSLYRSGIKTLPKAADISCDGSCEPSDVTLLKKYILGVEKTLPSKSVTEESVFSAALSEDMCVKANNENEDVGQLIVAGYNAASVRRVFIKFSAKDIPTQSTSRAVLTLTLMKSSNGNTEVKAYSCAPDWTENSVPAYNDCPAADGLLDAVNISHPATDGAQVQLDVTDYIRDNPSQSEYSFVLLCDHANDSAGLSNLAFFYSKEKDATKAPRLDITCGGSSENGKSVFDGEDTLRLETAAQSGRFLRVSDGAVTTGKNVSPLYDARFIERKGLAGNNTVSLESVTEPGMYLTRKSGASEIILAQNGGAIPENASFVKCMGTQDSTVSYELYGQAGRYIRCINGVVVAGATDYSANAKSACFRLRSESNYMLNENFDGDSLNTDVWGYHYPWGRQHNYTAVTRESQVAVRDSRLILTATRVADDNWIKDDKGETGYTDKIGENQWRKYSHLTGVVHLPYSKYPLNGNVYIEGSFKMPDKTGFWPAFWLNGYNSWPPEIDIFEYLSNTPEKIYVGIHRRDTSVSNNDAGQGWWITKTRDFFAEEFHRYAIDWGETYINYYIDDILVRSVEDSAVVNNQQHMYMIINLGVGGWAAEPEDSVGENTTYECDYVKILNY